MKRTLLAIFFFFALNALAQKEKALEYYNLCNKAELAICDSNIEGAHQLYEQAFRINPTKQFSTDLINAFQCAMDLKKFSIAEQYFKILLSRGLKSQIIQNLCRTNDSLIINEWLFKYHNDTSKYEHPIRVEISELMVSDQNVRKYFGEIHPDGNYMTDSVYKVDSVNALLLKNLFLQFGGRLPNEDIIGNCLGDIPYFALMVHHIGGGIAGKKSNYFDSLLYKSIFTYDLNPNNYASILAINYTGFKDSTYCYLNNCITFPISIFVLKYDGEVYPEYFSDEIEDRMNDDRSKIGLCSLSDMRKKFWFMHEHKKYKSILSKYGFQIGLSGYLRAFTLEEVKDWDKKNEPYKPKK